MYIILSLELDQVGCCNGWTGQLFVYEGSTSSGQTRMVFWNQQHSLFVDLKYLCFLLVYRRYQRIIYARGRRGQKQDGIHVILVGQTRINLRYLVEVLRVSYQNYLEAYLLSVKEFLHTSITLLVPISQ